jgi:hypothetical protein
VHLAQCDPQFETAELTRRREPKTLVPQTAEQDPLEEAIDPHPVIRFIKECVAAEPGHRVSLPRLYVAFRNCPYGALGAAEFSAAMRMICEIAVAH